MTSCATASTYSPSTSFVPMIGSSLFTSEHRVTSRVYSHMTAYSPSLIFDTAVAFELAAVLGDDGCNAAQQTQTEALCHADQAQEDSRPHDPTIHSHSHHLIIVSFSHVNITLQARMPVELLRKRKERSGQS